MSDDTELLLRRALRAEADAADPSADGLRVIRGRIAAGAGRPVRGRARRVAPLVAAVAAGAVVVGGVALATRDTRSPAPQPGRTTAPAVVVTPSPAPSPSATTTGGRSQAVLLDVPVYALRLEGDQARLVREFRTVPVRGDRVTSAVSALALDPVDPDYATFWRRPSRLDVDVRADRIVVDLSADAFADPDVGSGELAKASLQQLVWTVTAAAGKNLPVEVRVDGRNGAGMWGGLGFGGVLARDPDRRALVWIDTPAQGVSVAGGTQHVTGQGAGFEATFRYRVTAASGEVARGFVTGTSAGGSYGWWTFDIPLHLPKGLYTVTVEADNPASGADAGPAWEDTKRFSVR